MNFRSLSCCATLITAVGMTSCSDPEPATPRGGLTANIQPSASAQQGMACGVQKQVRIGDPAISRTDASGRISDGKDGAEIACIVRPSGDGFEISVEAFQPNTPTQGGGHVIFAASGTIGSDRNGSGSLTIGYDIVRISSPSDGCTFQTQGDRLQVEPGKIWAAFDCTAWDKSQLNSTFCGVRGVMAFDNCAK